VVEAELDPEGTVAGEPFLQLLTWITSTAFPKIRSVEPLEKRNLIATLAVTRPRLLYYTAPMARNCEEGQARLHESWQLASGFSAALKNTKRAVTAARENPACRILKWFGMQCSGGIVAAIFCGGAVTPGL